MAVSTVGMSSWINKQNADAAYRGLYLNRFWESCIKSDLKPFSRVHTACFASYALFTTFNQIEYRLSPDRVTPYGRGFIPDPCGPYFYTAFLLAALNSTKLFMEFVSKTDKPSSEKPAPLTTVDRCFVVISKATPYLMIITNIAVTIFQIRQGDCSAWITLAFTGITLINTTPWKPTKYEWYRATALGCPVSAAAFYYADNKPRSIIIILALDLAFSHETSRKKIKDFMDFVERLTAQMNKICEELKNQEKVNLLLGLLSQGSTLE